jgi:hypothetical protein
MIIATELISATTLTNIFKREVIDACTCRAVARLLFKSTVMCLDGKSVKEHMDEMIATLMECDALSFENSSIDLATDDNVLEYGWDALNDFESAYRRCARMIEDMWFTMRLKTFDVSNF